MTAKENEVEQLFQKALEYFSSGLDSQAYSTLEQVIQLNPKFIEAYNYQAIILKKQGVLQPAIEKFEYVISKYPGSYEALVNTGICYNQLGQTEKAIEVFQKAIEINPDYSVAHANLGATLQLQGKYQEAVSAYQEYIGLIPDNASIYNNIGLAFDAQDNPEQAINYYLQAIRLDTANYIFYNNLALALQNLGKYEEAINYFLQALKLEREDPDLYNHLGLAYHLNEQYTEAENNYLAAIRKFPEEADLYTNLGSVQLSLEKIDEACFYFSRAVQLDPDNAKFNYNLALGLEKSGSYPQAINQYLQTIKLKGDYAEAHFNLSLLLLLQGEFKTGWKELEWRWLSDDGPRISARGKRWTGENLKDKTIFIKHEQGLGDAIQFSRYIPNLAAAGARIIFECPEAVKSLLENIEGISETVIYTAAEETKTNYDYYIPLMSLPLQYKTTLENIPLNIPYLSVLKTAKQKWLERLDIISGYKIGIVWEGSFINKNNRKRSCPVEYFYELAEKLNIRFFSLQKGANLSRLSPENGRIIDLATEITDFSDTAAIISNLDLIISVDTSVAHLAGALGKEVRTILNYYPDWRWLLEREDCPWYPSMKLFRQENPGEWQPIFAKLFTELEAAIKSRL